MPFAFRSAFRISNWDRYNGRIVRRVKRTMEHDFALQSAEARTQLVKETVEQWQTDHGDVMAAYNADDILLELANLSDHVVMLVHRLEQTSPQNLTNFDVLRANRLHQLIALLEWAASIGETLASDVENRGYPIDSHERFQKAIAPLVSTKHSFRERWTFPTPNSIDRAKEAVHANLYVVLE